MRAASDCGETDRGDVRGYSGGECLWRKAGQPWKQGDTAESRVEGGTITIASPPICQHWQMNNREGAALKACRTHLQKRTAPGSRSEGHLEQQKRTAPGVPL